MNGPDRAARDLLSLIAREHERIIEKLEALDGPTSAESRSRTFRSAERMFRRHLRGEERSVYAWLEHHSPQETRDVRKGLEYHRLLDRLLEEISALDPGTEAWTRRCAALKLCAEIHFAHEEKDLFPRIVKLLHPRVARQLERALISPRMPADSPAALGT